MLLATTALTHAQRGYDATDRQPNETDLDLNYRLGLKIAGNIWDEHTNQLNITYLVVFRRIIPLTYLYL